MGLIKYTTIRYSKYNCINYSFHRNLIDYNLREDVFAEIPNELLLKHKSISIN